MTNDRDPTHLTDEQLSNVDRALCEHRLEVDAVVTRFAGRGERAEIGARIDPTTAFVFFEYRGLDPYGEETHEEECYGRSWFAVDPSNGIAVSFSDLPEETARQLEDKRRKANTDAWERLLGRRL